MAWIKGKAYPIIASAAEQGNEKAQKILDMQSGDIAQESLDKAVDDFFGSFSSANETKSQKANETSGVSKYVAEARKKYDPKAFGNFMKDIEQAKNENDLTGIRIKMSQDYSGYVINDSEFDKIRKAISDKKVKLSQKKRL